MPRLLIEPRPYSLIRVQNLRTPFSSPRCISPLSLFLSTTCCSSHPPPPREALQPCCAAIALLRPPSPQAVASGSSYKVVTSSRRWLFFARQICRHHGLLFDAVPSHQAPSMLPSQDGLDADAIKRLPFILHQRATAEESECCIYLDAFVDVAKLKVLPGCEYSFHSECVERDGSREGIHSGGFMRDAGRNGNGDC
ncbi:hypothetical protein DEO72_LG11g315 [Vigna unguiculata]|uniref:RING-type domain-containing protein n=1 Tax=Vigna unguiculata TaxID=3917 RepID=A0A4D6NJV5_VIGUN|nr:hypothetical protein DEO72_LG11g315 [Vigna unguiculata]